MGGKGSGVKAGTKRGLYKTTGVTHPRRAGRWNPRMRARDAVYRAVTSGKLLHATELLCANCSEPAQRYDHYLGYAPMHWLDVQAVCQSCDGKRRAARGEAHNKYTKTQ